MDVKSGGGGGGGTKAPTPASKGVLPKAADKQFVPPTPIITKAEPYLMAEPTIVAPQLANLLPVTDLLHMGDPNGLVGPPSAGEGTGGGIGAGTGHGVGTGDGPGAGPGSGGGFGGGVFRVGGAGGASAPTCPVQPEPNYSDDARKAHIQGTVVLDSIIQKDGTIDVTGVSRSLGYGLDDEAKKVLKKWKCNPGKREGQAVAVQLQIVINFHLY
jgi:TonB family protein